MSEDPRRRDEDALARLLADAVSDIEPSDRLAEIHARTRANRIDQPRIDRHRSRSRSPSQEPSMARRTSTRSSWTFAATGALLAAAAIVAVFLVFSPGDDDPVGPAAGGTHDGAASDGPADADGADGPDGDEEPSSDGGGTDGAQPADAGEVTAVYYVSATNAGPRLFREFQKANGPDSLSRALSLLQSPPLDPDYTQVWPADSLTDAKADGGLVTVELTSPQYRALPAGLDQAEAEAAVQSVVYTLQGAMQERVPVQFLLDGDPVDQVLGVPTHGEPFANTPVLETLNLMSITEPQSGSTHSATMKISGVANSFEATVQWRLIAAGGKVAKEGFTTAEGWMDDRLFPWSDTVDLSGLAPGDYTFVAQTDDPSGGAEGHGPDVDTKRITIS